MWMTFRHREENYTRHWRGEWWIGVRHDFPMDSYLIGFGVWGFCLRAETLWRWRGNIRELQSKVLRNRFVAWILRRGRNRTVHNGESASQRIERLCAEPREPTDT